MDGTLRSVGNGPLSQRKQCVAALYRGGNRVGGGGCGRTSYPPTTGRAAEVALARADARFARLHSAALMAHPDVTAPDVEDHGAVPDVADVAGDRMQVEGLE